MKEEVKEKCWSCLHYKAYYLRGTSRFYKQSKGVCPRHKKNVDEQECCEDWCDGMLSNHIRKRVLSEQFAEVVHKLTAIEQALKENINVNEL